jgi:hypothetical protein
MDSSPVDKLQTGVKAGARKLLGPANVQRINSWRNRLPEPEIRYVPRPNEDDGPRTLWPSFAPPKYLGQLTDDFQQQLAVEREYIERRDCDWYHTSELVSGEVIPGAWDLRGGEGYYIGHLPLAGRKVLEFGPATGAMTFFMEHEGADVTCVEAGFDVSINLMPLPGVNERERRMHAMQAIGAVNNSWWYLHRDRGSKAKIVYCDIYDLPGDLPQYDVAVFGAILLHLQNPYAALAQGAAHAREQIVVTDLMPDLPGSPDDNLLRFNPHGVGEESTHWWWMTPGAVVAMLARLGFGETRVTEHSQKHHIGHDLSGAPVDAHMYTVVADRTW